MVYSYQVRKVVRNEGQDTITTENYAINDNEYLNYFPPIKFYYLEDMKLLLSFHKEQLFGLISYSTALKMATKKAREQVVVALPLMVISINTRACSETAGQ